MTTLDTAGFIQNIFTVRLAPTTGAPNGDFSNYAGIVRYALMNDDPGTPGSTPTTPILDSTILSILNDVNNGQWNALPDYYSKGKCRDTSLGGNDAINCYPQFNETDDVSEHPFLSVTPGDPLSGMGRVYSEVYDDQQQIMYLTFGTPKFNSLTNFYNNAIYPDLAKLMNNGSGQVNLGYLFGQVVGTFITIPTLPLAFIYNIIGQITDTKITKYYEFRNAMPLYYRAVNSMVLHLAVNLGLEKDTLISQQPITNDSNASANTSLTPEELAAKELAVAAGVQYNPDLNIFHKFDIYRIMLKKYRYSDGFVPGPNDSTDYTLLNSTQDASIVQDPSGSFAKDFITSFVGTLYDADLYVGFRIEKGVDNSESFSNETGESSIAQQVNSKAQAARDARFSTANGNIDDGAISSFLSGVGSIVSGVASALGASSIENIMAGSGIVDFPDVWKNSSFSKSYHFNVSLRSPYGDPYSIMQNLYVPLAMLLAGGLPRAIGQSAYTAPFVCRAYCKGMFAVPLGMITSMSIKRGADQFGWNSQRLPTCIDVSFEIKDLSPAMYLAIGDGGTISAFKEIFATNSSFQEYLMTLSGMGLADRLIWIRNIRRKASYLLSQINSSKFSPFYWGSAAGNTTVGRLISNFLPSTKLPNR